MGLETQKDLDSGLSPSKAFSLSAYVSTSANNEDHNTCLKNQALKNSIY